MMVVPALLLTVTTGCQTMVPISASSMDPIEGLNATPVNVLQEVTDARKKKTNQVGRHTFTVFMIPTIPVFEENSLHKGVGEALSSALNQAGYKATVVEKVDQADGPVLNVQIDSMRNYLFSWLWPLGLTGGRAKMTPVLFDNEGNVLWKGKPCVAWGGCPSLIYMTGFETSVGMEVGSIFRQILAQMGTEDFRKALNSKNSQTVSSN
jgi:hypothetical protein